MRPVYVRWVDSGRSSGWESPESAIAWANEDEMFCESVAWLVSENADWVLISSSRHTVEDETREVLQSLQIPRRAILDIKELEIPSGKAEFSATKEASVVEFRRPQPLLSGAGQVSCCEREGACGAGCQGWSDVEGAGGEDRLESEPCPREGA